MTAPDTVATFAASVIARCRQLYGIETREQGERMTPEQITAVVAVAMTDLTAGQRAELAGILAGAR